MSTLPTSSLPTNETATPATSGAVANQAPKRHKSWGEHLFNFTTYAGFALIGNELTSTAIVNQKDKANWLGDAFRKGENFFRNIGREGQWKYIQGRMNYISFAILGGMVMVPFIKLLEDNKSTLVRTADHVLYGKKADTDPDLIDAHEEMDRSPHQSWSSLLKGRLLTVGAAYTVDSTVGWEGGMLARHLKGTRFERFSSFDHLSNFAADKLSPSVSALLKTEKAATNHVMRQGAGLLTLSTALTILFYASSKFFAARREVNVKRTETIHELEQAGVIPAKRTLLDAHAGKSVDDTQPHPDKPRTSIREAVMEPSRLSAVNDQLSPA